MRPTLQEIPRRSITVKNAWHRCAPVWRPGTLWNATSSACSFRMYWGWDDIAVWINLASIQCTVTPINGMRLELLQRSDVKEIFPIEFCIYKYINKSQIIWSKCCATCLDLFQKMFKVHIPHFQNVFSSKVQCGMSSSLRSGWSIIKMRRKWGDSMTLMLYAERSVERNHPKKLHNTYLVISNNKIQNCINKRLRWVLRYFKF